MTNLFPVITMSYAVGIFIGSIVSCNVVLLFASCTVLFLVILWKVAHKRKVGLLLIVLVPLLGLFRYQFLWQQPSSLDDLRGKKVVVTGTVLQEPLQQRDKLTFILHIDTVETAQGTIPTQEKVVVESRQRSQGPTYGERIQVEGQVLSPAQPANFHSFNYSSYLRRQGIKYLLRTGAEGITRLSQGEGSFLVSSALRVKKSILAIIEKTLPPSQALVLRSLLFGEREVLEPELLRQLERSGVVHLLAVSGLHVGFVAGLGYGLGMLLKWPPRITAVFAGLIAGFYLLLIGFRASVFRAGIMLWIGVIGLLLNRRSNSMTALSVAAMVLLVVRPGLLFTPGFQLSFAATWGILYLSPLVAELLRFLPRWLAFPLAVSAAAQMATGPILAYHFYGIATWTILNNLLAVPLAGAIMSLGIISCGVGFFFLPLAELLGAANSILITLFVGITGITAAFPGAYLYVAPPQPVFLAFYYGLLFFLPRLRTVSFRQEENNTRTLAVVLISALLLGFFWLAPSFGPARLEVTFLSVGAGDAAVVTLPGGRTYLIDAGPGGEQGFDAGTSVVVPHLRRRGTRRLELIFLTHPHQDHWGGLEAVTTEIPVGGIVLPPGFPPGEFGIGDGFAVPLFRAQAGDRLDLGQGVIMEVLHPPAAPLTATNDDSNNNSLVLLLKKGEVSFLLTGDLEAAGENHMLQYNRVPSATVLKVAHHGARTSSGLDFLQRVQPALAVISTGPNSFGHPHRETLDRLALLGIETYRTDEDGAVRVRTDGKGIWVETAREGDDRKPAGGY